MGFQDWKAEAQAPKSGGSVDWSKVFGQTSTPAGATPSAIPGAAPQAEPTLVIPEADHPAGGGDFASRAISNLPGSAGRFAEGLFTAAAHPINTLGTLGGIMSGELAKGAQQLGYHGLDDPAAERLAGALNENLAKNYGSWEGFKEYAATDPVAALSDLSMIAGGAGVAAKASGLPRVAGAASKLSSAIDPVGMAAKVATAPLSAANAFGRGAMGHFSGVPGETLKEIEGIARGSDAAAKEAFKAARAGGDPHAAVDAAKEALKQLGAAASDEYTATRSNLTTKQLDTQPILDKIAEAEAALGSNAAINYPDELAILGEMRNRVSSMKNTSAAELNHLKIGLNDLINDSARQNKKGMFSPVTEAVKSVISAEDPTYSQMLEGWQRWRGDLRNIEDLLGKGDRRSAMSQLGAMMKAMKTGNKGAALTLLENAPSGKHIRPMLAGTIVSPWRSSGQTLMQDMIESGAIFALTGGHPATVLPFAMSSPRGASHVAYAMGKAKGIGDKASQYAGTPAIRGAMARIGQTPYVEEDRAERKAGGRVGFDHEAAADQLVRAAERAKGDLGKTTEGMLSMPDETIVKALDVAKRNI